jgi:YHS domain-containing protein
MTQTTKTNENSRGCSCGSAQTDAVAKAPERYSVPERLDPACGMTVALEPPATLRVDHEGVTFWFCCAGCRRKFAAHPALFLDEPASGGCCS